MRNAIFLMLVAGWVYGWSRAAEGKEQKDIVYHEKELGAEGGQQTALDLYAPESGKEMPIVVWIHGGGWKHGDKKAVQEKPEFFNGQGMILVSLNYRLHPDADYRGQAGDIAKGVRWVHDHAKEYGGSPDRIFLLGHSAGAHLAALVSTDEKYLKEVGLDLKNLRGTILLDGAGYDIPKNVKLTFPRLRNTYTSVFGEDEEGQRKASPIEYVESGKGIPPFLILYVADRPGSKLQSNQFGEKLNEAGCKTEVIAAENKTHATINREIGLEGDLPTREILKFLQNLSTKTP